MTTQDHIDDFVRKALIFDRLQEMGMIGAGGKLATAEASRRNAWIRQKQKEFGITSNQLRIMKEEAKKKGELS